MIEKLTCVSRQGFESLLNVGFKADGYAGEQANKVLNDGVIGVKWEHKGKGYGLFFSLEEGEGKSDFRISPYPTRDFKYLIIIFKNHSDYPLPNNGIIFSATGKLVKRLQCPSADRLEGFLQVGWSEDSRKMIVSCMKKPRNHYFLEDRELLIPSFKFTNEVVKSYRL